MLVRKDVSDSVGTSERNRFDCWMINDFVTSFGTGTDDQVQNAGRYSGLFKDFSDPRCGSRV
jgi:hypothetical protein